MAAAGSDASMENLFIDICLGRQYLFAASGAFGFLKGVAAASGRFRASGQVGFRVGYAGLSRRAGSPASPPARIEIP